jgi:bifunctional NMN adenylyltransferase/nudix hydrolase
VNKFTVFIGRFSPFHLGHEEVLLRALKSSEVVLLLIGSADSSRNVKNPFTAQERAKMITDWYEAQYNIVPNIGKLVIDGIQDHPYNDQEWIASVQTAVLKCRKNWDIPDAWPTFLTGAERDASTWYLKAFGSFFKLDLVKETTVGFDYSATQLRDNFFTGGNAWEYKTPYSVICFLQRFKTTDNYINLVQEFNYIKNYKESWKNSPFPPFFVTVDACVVQSGHVLVVERSKAPGKGLIALPGGFVNVNERLVDAAVRELQEETDIEMSPAQLYGSIQDSIQFDHPERSLRGRIITTCYLFKLKDTYSLPKIKPQLREVSKAYWLPVSKALADHSAWFEDHGHMFKTMLGRLK